MWYPAKVTVAPASEPVSLEEAKRQLNVFHDDDDDLIGGMISAVRDHVEKYCGAVFASRMVETQATAWPDMARLPVTPVNAVTSISYVDSAGQATTLPDTVYELRGEAIRLGYGQQWPALQMGSLITLVATVGYEEVPPAVKHAILLRITDFYDNRGSEDDSKWSGFDSLLSNYRF